MPIRYRQRFANWLAYRRARSRLDDIDDRLLADMGLTRDTLIERLKQAHDLKG